MARIKILKHNKAGNTSSYFITGSRYFQLQIELCSLVLSQMLSFLMSQSHCDVSHITSNTFKSHVDTTPPTVKLHARSFDQIDQWSCQIDSIDHLVKLPMYWSTPIKLYWSTPVKSYWSNCIDQLRSNLIDQIGSSCIDHPRRKSLWLRTFFSCFRNFDTMSAGWSRTDKSLGMNHFLFLIFDLWFVHLYIIIDIL